jgi:integrase
MNENFSSHLSTDMKEFLRFKRALGYKYIRSAATLLSFDRFVAQCSRTGADGSLESLIYNWLARIEGRKPFTISSDLAVVRQFCLFLRRKDPRAFVPSHDWISEPKTTQFRPYIFSRKEVLALLESTNSLRGSRFRALSIRTLLLVLYCTGLRFGEALRLRPDDVDVDNRVLRIRETKGKARFVPIRDDLCRELRKYVGERNRVAKRNPQTSFFVRTNGQSYSISAASYTVRFLLRRIGLKPAKGRSGPRPYDLRHTFAVHRLTQWYRSGVDIHSRLPLLSAYMGHENILGTEDYLTATPDLLAIAGRRFESRFRRTPKRK